MNYKSVSPRYPIDQNKITTTDWIPHRGHSHGQSKSMAKEASPWVPQNFEPFKGPQNNFQDTLINIIENKYLLTNIYSFIVTNIY